MFYGSQKEANNFGAVRSGDGIGIKGIIDLCDSGRIGTEIRLNRYMNMDIFWFNCPAYIC